MSGMRAYDFLKSLFVAKSIQGIDLSGLTGREYSCSESYESTEASNDGNEPKWTVEEVNCVTTETGSNNINKEVDDLSFEITKKNTTSWPQESHKSRKNDEHDRDIA